MLNLKIASPAALRQAAKKATAKGDYAEAEACLMTVLSRNEKDQQALLLLADNCVQQKRVPDAYSFYVMAVLANPSDVGARQKFIQMVNNFQVQRYNDLTDGAIVACLRDADTLDCSKLRALWVSHSISRPEFHAAFGLDGRGAFEVQNKIDFAGFQNFKPLFFESFLLGLKNFIVYSPVFEEFMGHIRRHLLLDYIGDQKKFTIEEATILADALAHYGFYSDYVLQVMDDEQKIIDDLSKKVEQGRATATEVVLLGCYQPLYKLANKEKIEAEFKGEAAIRDAIKIQITDYLLLHTAAKNIKAITPIDDEVSKIVRAQYEEFPYPRWRALPDSSVLDGWKMAGNDLAVTEHLRRKKAKILIAGCGTGTETVMMATTYPEAEVWAVDLSLTSIAYAETKAKEFGVKNIKFYQADILNLGVLEERFDCIVSGGVLHHIHDPVAAWKVLRELLKPHGIMMIGLYSKIARRSILEGQRLVKENGFSNDSQSMRAFRRKCPDIMDKFALHEMVFFADYYYLNMYRDMLFHVQEKNYDLPELETVLADVGVEFAGFAGAPEVQERFKQENSASEALFDLKSWDQFERKYPNTFAAMYMFWCKNKLVTV